MTHSPTPNSAEQSIIHQFVARGIEVAEAQAVIAKVKVDAVAEYKALPVSDAEVEAAAQAHWVQEREDQAPYAPVYADEWHELDWSVMEHHRRRVRPILEAARGAR